MSVSPRTLNGEVDPDRNRLEIVRFPSDEARIQAIDVLLARGKLSLSTSEPNVWSVRTDVVRALMSASVPFEWLTRNLT